LSALTLPAFVCLVLVLPLLFHGFATSGRRQLQTEFAARDEELCQLGRQLASLRQACHQLESERQSSALRVASLQAQIAAARSELDQLRAAAGGRIAA
jgi:septal ring factor EnvC (AmiA/AmiB activator)